MEQPKVKQAAGAGLSRILQHIQESDIAMITAFRNVDGNSRKDNIGFNDELQNDIRWLGYGYIQLEGWYWSEDDIEPRPEDTFFVINNDVRGFDEFRDLMIGLCAKYGQECVLIKQKDGDACFYDGSGNMTFSLGSNISLADIEKGIGDGWSRRKGKDFRFAAVKKEYARVPITGSLQGMGRAAKRKHILAYIRRKS